VRLLGRFSRRVAVSYDPDSAGQAATERSLNLLLEQGLEVRVVTLPAGFDPDSFVRQQGGEAYRAQVKNARPYLEYLLERARATYDLSARDAKVAALNYLLPYLARVPNKIQRAEWAAEVAQRLGIEEALLREELRRAAAERRPELRVRQEFTPPAVKPAERRLLQIVLENPAIRPDILKELHDTQAHRGTTLENVFEQVLASEEAGAGLEVASLGERVGEAERRLLYALAFERAAAGTLEEARSCLAALEARAWERRLQELNKKTEEASKRGDAQEANRLAGEKQKLYQKWQEFRRLHLKDTRGS